MATVAAPLVVLVVGLLLFVMPGIPPKLARVGEMMLFCGLFWLVYLLSGRAVHFG